MLRRRSRLLDDAAHRTDLGPARKHNRHPGPGTLPAPLLHRCFGLLQARRTLTPDYRPKRHADHKRGGRRSFTWTDYRDLLIAAHQQLGAPIVLVWDNLNVHKDRRLREFIDTHDWISCYSLPAHAPDLNPVEGIWSLLRRSSQANAAFTDPDHLISTLRHGLRHIQYRDNLINGCLAETGLTLTTSLQQRQ